MAYFSSKYHIGINGDGFTLAKSSSGRFFYQKKLAPVFVNKFGSGDSSYRDSTFWQFWATNNARNGAKQLLLDDPGKFWKSENVNVTQLNEVTLSKAMTLIGTTAANTSVNTLEAWRNSQSWWNSNYGYRQQITVTAPASQQVPAGYPVQITIDTAALQTASKLRSDRNDWRIIYFNGSSSVELFRDYVSTTSTYFATQAAISAGASDSSYFVYYGYSAEATNKQPSAEADWNSVYGMYGTTPDASSSALFHFREGSGTSVNDDSSSANNGTLVNTPSWGTDGKIGRYISLNGTNQAMSLPNLSLGSFTMEGWIYINNFVSSRQVIAQQRENASGAGSNFTFDVTGSGGSTGGLYFDGIGLTRFGADNVLGFSGWYHVAVTGDGSTMKLYVGGAQVASQGNPALTASDQGYNIGRSIESSTGNNFNGRIQHFRFSNAARTSFPYVLSSEPVSTNGTEITTLPPSSSFDLYTGNSDGKIYKWDGASTFSEQFDTRRTVFFETGNDTDMVIGDTGGTEKAQAMAFQLTTESAKSKIKGVELYLKKSAGTPTAITIRIETDSAGTPSGTLLDASLTGTIPAFTTTSYGWVSLDFASSFAGSASTKYWIVAKIAAGPNDNNYSWAADGSSPAYASGNMASSTDGGTTWSADTAKDAYFRIKGEATQVNDLMSSSVGGTRKMLIATGDVSSQTSGDAKLHSYDGSNYSLEHTFNTSTESQITRLAEFNGKLYAAVGPQARIYEGTSPTSWTLSKDIDVPQNPGYIYALKEYNGQLYAGGGSPEFLYDKHYNGFMYRFDTTSWSSLYPFDFTEIRAFEFYDSFLFVSTYHGQIYVYDTASLNPLFNFKDDYAYKLSVQAMQLYDDKIYFFLTPQDNSGETNVAIWVFDRHGMSAAHLISGATGYQAAAVVNNLLIVATKGDGKVYKLNPDNYASSGFFQTSYFDAGLPSINKLYNAIDITHDPLNVGESITLYYKFKETDSWTLLGTSDTAASTGKTLSFASGIISKKITIKVVLATSNSATTPKLKEMVMQYKLQPVNKWLWTMKLIAKKKIGLADKTTDARSASTIRTALENAQNSNALVTFVDIDGTSYSALFDTIDQSSWVINQADTNEDEIAVTLLEA